jgi:hypothetical protein
MKVIVCNCGRAAIRRIENGCHKYTCPNERCQFCHYEAVSQEEPLVQKQLSLIDMLDIMLKEKKDE